MRDLPRKDLGITYWTRNGYNDGYADGTRNGYNDGYADAIMDVAA